MKKVSLTTIILIISLIIVGGVLAYLFFKPSQPSPIKKCGDGICGDLENWKNCIKDCEKPVKLFCGDKVCEKGEEKTCLKDCPAKSVCGDNICDAKEMANPSLCPKDCEKIPITPVCGDRICNGAETCSSCVEDCGDCPVAPSEGESHFGVHLGSLNYNSVSYIRELGEQIYVRNEFYGDVFGWKQVKNEKAVSECQSCCDSSKSSCDCRSGDKYYCEPDSRDNLLETPIVADFYNNNFNQFVNFYTSRYDDTLPKEFTADYPHGHENIYRDYVSFLVQNFGNKIKYWEVGNENAALAFWAGTPEEYADMLVIASEEIKKNCVDCKVGISFAHPNVGAKTPEQKELWHSAIGEVCNSFDFIDAHFFYPSFITQGELDRWKETCPGKEFISTETGVLDYMEPGGKSQNSGGSLEKQAQDLAKYNTLLFAEGYNKIYMYLMDTDYGTGDIFLHNGLIDDIGNTRKPAFNSYKTMIWKIDYFTSITKLADGQYKYAFSNKNPVYVLWCDSGSCAIPSEITGTVKVTDYLGNEQTKDASQIVLDTSPVFVEEIE